MEQDKLNDLLRDIDKPALQPTTEEQTRRFQSIVVTHLTDAVEHLAGIRRALETLASAHTGTTSSETPQKTSGE